MRLLSYLLEKRLLRKRETSQKFNLEHETNKVEEEEGKEIVVSLYNNAKISFLKGRIIIRNSSVFFNYFPYYIYVLPYFLLSKNY